MQTPDPDQAVAPEPALDDATEQWRDGVLELAASALSLAIDEDAAGAINAVEQCRLRFGPYAMVLAMAAWIDTAALRLGIEPGPENSIQLGFISEKTGEMTTNADEVEPTYRWAGRLMVARMAGDFDQFRALMNSVPRDPAIQGDHIFALLQSLSTMLRTGLGGPVAMPTGAP